MLINKKSSISKWRRALLLQAYLLFSIPFDHENLYYSSFISTYEIQYICLQLNELEIIEQ